MNVCAWLSASVSNCKYVQARAASHTFDFFNFEFSVALPASTPYALVGTRSPGRPPRFLHSGRERRNGERGGRGDEREREPAGEMGKRGG